MRELTLRLCVDNQYSSYCFRCPTCGRATVHGLDEQAMSLLMAHGATMQPWRLPADWFARCVDQPARPLVTKAAGTHPRS